MKMIWDDLSKKQKRVVKIAIILGIIFSLAWILFAIRQKLAWVPMGA